MEQRVREAGKLFREPAVTEPSPRKLARVLPTQLAGITRFTYDPQQYQAIESALIEHARRMAEERKE